MDDTDAIRSSPLIGAKSAYGITSVPSGCTVGIGPENVDFASPGCSCTGAVHVKPPSTEWRTASHCVFTSTYAR